MIVREEVNRDRLMGCSKRAGDRCDWRVYAFVLISNHLHVSCPRPKLAPGMHTFLSSYANGWPRRHRVMGHVFEGRYRTALVEDESYLWVLTRHLHPNPQTS
jgi:REP-associated tyrosine transposase